MWFLTKKKKNMNWKAIRKDNFIDKFNEMPNIGERVLLSSLTKDGLTEVSIGVLTDEGYFEIEGDRSGEITHWAKLISNNVKIKHISNLSKKDAVLIAYHTLPRSLISLFDESKMPHEVRKNLEGIIEVEFPSENMKVLLFPDGSVELVYKHGFISIGGLYTNTYRHFLKMQELGYYF